MTPEQLLKLQLFHAELRAAEFYKDWGKVAILLRDLDGIIKATDPVEHETRTLAPTPDDHKTD